MPDITMCVNHVCPSCKKCYRYRAIPSEFLQSVAQYEPLEGEDKCDDFWDIGKRKDITTHGESGFDILPGDSRVHEN